MDYLNWLMLNPHAWPLAALSLLLIIIVLLAFRRKPQLPTSDLEDNIRMLTLAHNGAVDRVAALERQVAEIQGTFDKVKGAMEEMLTEFANEESELRREVRELREEVSILQQDQTNLN